MVESKSNPLSHTDTPTGFAGALIFEPGQDGLVKVGKKVSFSI
jgi:hypothetical protein